MIQVQKAQESDAPRIAAYVTALMEEAPDTIPRRPPPTIEDELRIIRQVDRLESAIILIAVKFEEVVGFLDLWAGTSPETRHVAIFGMSVSKAHRNRGIGRMLVEAAIAFAEAREAISRLELEVVARNAVAIRLYENLGFRAEGRKVKAVNLCGTTEDVLVMARVW